MLKNNNLALLLLHDNLSSSKIWRHVFKSQRITEMWRVVALDLPGHGASSNAPGPEKSYSMRGYADHAVYILPYLNIEKVVVLGWGLGGCVGIEMILLLRHLPSPSKSPFHHVPTDIIGLILTGTPPALGPDQITRDFTIRDGDMSFAAQNHWTDKHAELFACETAPAGNPELFGNWKLDSAKRTDGRERMLMWKKFGEGVGTDQRSVVESEDVLTGVVNGGTDPYINLEYLDEINWKRFWKRKCVRLKDWKHTPF